MKKSIKIIVLGLAIFIAGSFLLLLGGSFLLYKDVTNEQNLDLTYLEAMEALVAGHSQKEYKKQIKGSYSQENLLHVSIYYNENSGELLPITKEILNLAFTKTEAVFGEISYEPVDFILLEEGEELAKLSGNKDLDGFYTEIDGVFAVQYYDKELILERDKSSLNTFQEIILHEYTHYAFARKTQDWDIYPAWFREGVSEYVGDEGWGASLHDYEIIPFAQLNTQKQWEEANALAETNNYVQSYNLIMNLTNEYGEGLIKEIMDSVNETKNFEKSFEEVTGLTISDLDELKLGALKY